MRSTDDQTLQDALLAAAAGSAPHTPRANGNGSANNMFLAGQGGDSPRQTLDMVGQRSMSGSNLGGNGRVCGPGVCNGRRLLLAHAAPGIRDMGCSTNPVHLLQHHPRRRRTNASNGTCSCISCLPQGSRL